MGEDNTCTAEVQSWFELRCLCEQLVLLVSAEESEWDVNLIRPASLSSSTQRHRDTKYENLQCQKRNLPPLCLFPLLSLDSLIPAPTSRTLSKLQSGTMVRGRWGILECKDVMGDNFTKKIRWNDLGMVGTGTDFCAPTGVRRPIFFLSNDKARTWSQSSLGHYHAYIIPLPPSSWVNYR